MNLNVIRKYVSDRPFKPLVFHLGNGEKQLLRHPEIIVTEIVVIAVDDEGLPVIIAPEAISAIHYAQNRTRRVRGRKKTVSAKKS